MWWRLDEDTLDRTEVGTGFSVICWFCRLRPFRFALKFSNEIFTPYRFSRLRSGFSEFVVSPWQFCCTICYWDLKYYPNCGVNTSFALVLRGRVSDASMFSNSSMSATRISPFQILPAIDAYPKNISGNTFLPNWWCLDWSRAEIG